LTQINGIYVRFGSKAGLMATNTNVRSVPLADNYPAYPVSRKGWNQPEKILGLVAISVQAYN
jgi:hypothetical protein